MMIDDMVEGDRQEAAAEEAMRLVFCAIGDAEAPGQAARWVAGALPPNADDEAVAEAALRMRALEIAVDALSCTCSADELRYPWSALEAPGAWVAALGLAGRFETARDSVCDPDAAPWMKIRAAACGAEYSMLPLAKSFDFEADCAAFESWLASAIANAGQQGWRVALACLDRLSAAMSRPGMGEGERDRLADVALAIFESLDEVDRLDVGQELLAKLAENGETLLPARLGIIV